ncbi:LuxR C-terminal-related transcriptional regulator [Streptomyces sp. 1331.2]|uniref:LuxR C-terminal-related transcriptional regulator n=1 Tax=Streptomyces sp. 1331.2 TaxID=1938835 RepID=UPI000BC4E6D0|nr:LuxR C-terminal-related transcriptional regulator [Streptomyces sp. 1331.2]SOB85696.1 LuxR family transcriptional regulator, maltose regulon positive regulatory protein [Streptomyces sp. 1331.2]
MASSPAARTRGHLVDGFRGDAGPSSRIPGGDPVLAARFAVPATPETFVRRQRLVDRLGDGLPTSLLLVSGPAGAGKTLFVADWVATARLPGPAVWLTVEHEDNAPGVFWAYLLEALRYHGVALPAGIGSPARANEVDHSLLARLAAHLSVRDEPVILVLDEFEQVSSAEVASGLHFLLGHAGAGLRLALLSRTEPLLPIHRYRASGSVTEIRAADLAFRPEEASVLLRRHGLALSAGNVRALTERTGGWAAGLRLSALAAQGAADPAAYLAEFEAGQSTVADFLLAEVLDTQPVETQDLLLRTSVLDRIHPDLADALTGRPDGARTLAALSRANAFVEPVGHSWYRCHPLFSEILRIHLGARSPGLERELHRKAARWLAGAGQLTEALPHAAAAGDWEFAASQVVDQLAIGRLFTGRDAERLDRLFATMAPEAQGPAAELVRAACDLTRHDVDKGAEHLRRAEALLAEHQGEDDPAALFTLAHLRVLAARLAGSADRARAAAEQAERLEESVPKALVAGHPELSTLRLNDLGSALLWEGSFGAASAALAAAARTPAGATTAGPRHEALACLALIDLLDGRPGRSEARLRRATAEAELAGLPPVSRTGVGQLVLATLAVDRDDLPTARAALDRAAGSAAARHDPAVAAVLAIVRARILLADGRARAALDALDRVDDGRPPAAGPLPAWVTEGAAVVGSAAHLADGDPAAALAVLDRDGAGGPDCAVAAARVHLAAGDGPSARRALDAIPDRDCHGPAVTARVLLARAQVAAALGDEAGARRLLTRALTVARSEQVVRPFREAGPWLRQLLRARPAPVDDHDWLPPDLLPGPPGAAGGDDAVPDPPVEPLSDREIEVLESAARLLSTEEIAAELFLSVNTVKTHLKSINRKLAVSGRRRAVRRARELRLI